MKNRSILSLIAIIGVTWITWNHPGYCQSKSDTTTVVMIPESTQIPGAQPSEAQTFPQFINYQGYLTDSNGSPVTGSVVLRVSIWDAEQGGRQWWSEENSCEIYQGYFAIELGKTTPLPTGLFAGENRWMQLVINDETLQPRKQIASVAYAMYTQNAGTLDGHPSDRFYLKDEANLHSQNSIDAAKLGGHPANSYLIRSQIEAGFVMKGLNNSISSEMIVDGTIQRQDIGFPMSSGDITAIVALNGLDGGGTSGDVKVGLNEVYRTGQAFDDRFVRKNEAGVVTSAMIQDETIGSVDIKNGSLLPADMGFVVGTINGVVAGSGLNGGGTAGTVNLALNSEFQSGSAYDARFVNVSEPNSVNSQMIVDGEITSADIKNGTLQREDMGFEISGIMSVTGSNGILTNTTNGAVTVQLQSAYQNGSAYDSRFIIKNEASSVSSAMIVDGTIQPRDLGFEPGDITSVQTSVTSGLTGGSFSGDVNLSLQSQYLSGDAYMAKFVSHGQPNAITGSMIKDGEVMSNDLAFQSIKGEHLINPFHFESIQLQQPLFSVRNNGNSENAIGIDVRGYDALRATGTRTGIHAEGSLYGVYAKATGTAGYSLYVEGKAFCSNGGWGDLAEYMPSEHRISPGDVVIIDSEHAMRIRQCDRPYDTRVAGVVSTNPTITVGTLKDGAANYPLALAGVVPCKVTADVPIYAGDLLTTSAVPGYAMKATDPQIGTILGKALEPLKNGRGIIHVLVCLH